MKLADQLKRMLSKEIEKRHIEFSDIQYNAIAKEIDIDLKPLSLTL